MRWVPNSVRNRRREPGLAASREELSSGRGDGSAASHDLSPETSGYVLITWTEARGLSSPGA